MTLGFKCSECNNEKVVGFLKVGNVSECHFFDATTKIPEDAAPAEESTLKRYTESVNRIVSHRRKNNESNSLRHDRSTTGAFVCFADF